MKPEATETRPDAGPDIRWSADGLAAAVVQDALTGQVLMLAWMNAEALRRTRETGEAHFWSRRRRTLWRKGETSGNVLRVESITVDCDRDALLLRAKPAGPACHTGETSCFFEPAPLAPNGPRSAPRSEAGSGTDPGSAPLGEILGRLAGIVASRARERPDGSYTAGLLADGPRRIAQKVGEEGVETALAGACGSEASLVAESADLLYHLLVLLESRGVAPERVSGELARRFPGGRDAND